jgi:pyruvate formate lyase activating enzyme
MAARNGLTLGGVVPFSTVDFPGRLAAVLFTQGCPLRCRYCHNPHLRRRAASPARDWAATVAWLRRRVGLLDAVVFSGGEPTIQPGLADALAEVRALGFATGLHSAGTHPRRLSQALKLLDWIGLDVKAPFDRYAAVTGSIGSGAQARRALDAVLASGISYELRTTVHAALLGAADLLAIAEDLQARWVRRWVLQVFRPTGCVDAALLAPAGPGWLDAVLPSLRSRVPDIVVR